MVGQVKVHPGGNGLLLLPLILHGVGGKAMMGV
jgi:hypothetical protein